MILRSDRCSASTALVVWIILRMLGANAKHGTTCCQARRQDAPIAG